MAKQTKVKFVTPVGIAAYAYFHKPDTEGQYANNKYKGDLILDGDTDLSALEAKCRSALEEKFPKVDLPDINLPFKSGDDHKNDEFHGKIILKASSKFAPQIVDTKRNKLPKGVQARSGDEVRFVAVLYPYEQTETVKVNGKKVQETVYGVSLQLQVVQLVNKNAGGGGVDELDDIDGFDASDADVPFDVDDDADNSADF